MNNGMQNQRIGSECINVLKHELYQKEIQQFDTDTVLLIVLAQHYFERNGFLHQGITKTLCESRRKSRAGKAI